MTKNDDVKSRAVVLDDLFKLKTLTEAKFSPDGGKVVYGVSHIEGEEVITKLWLLNLKNGDKRQLTSGKARDYSPDWSPDGKRIAFLTMREKTPQIHLIHADGGEALQLTELKQGVGTGPLWSPDGETLLFTAGPKMEEEPDPKAAYYLDRTVYRFDGMGYLDNLVQDIFTIPVEGGEPKQLTDDRFSNSNPRWSPDGKEILYMPQAGPDSSTPFCTGLKVVSLDGEIRDVLEDWGRFDNAVWSQDGKQIIFSGQVKDMPIGTKSDLWVMEKNGSEPKNRTEKLIYGVGGGLRNDVPAAWAAFPLLDETGKKAYVNVQQGGTLQVYAVALKGKESCKPVVNGERGAYLLDLAVDKLLFVETEVYNPCDLKTSSLDGSDEETLTELNKEFMQDWEQPKLERLLFKGSDGEEIEGWIVYPDKGEEPYPTIMMIHGGPHAAFGYAFNFDFQFLTSAGYAVLFINHRASTGYGNKFATMIKGDWGNLDYKDLMAGLDFAIEKGLVDPDKLGCTGISGGGNLSCWIVGNTDRFKAAMPENPVTNWQSFYGTSDVGIWFSVEELGGHPHEIPEIYTKCSPITYAHNCKTPTLMVQGENDYRCPAEQSEQFYSVLKANGCVAKMLRFPNSSHGGAVVGAIPIRRAHHEALLKWMNQYVLEMDEK